MRTKPPNFYTERIRTKHWRLERDTAVRRVLHEESSVDLTLIQLRRLVSRVDNVRSAGRLFEDTDLELTAARKVDAGRTRYTRELSSAGRVVDRCLAVGC